ELRAPTGPFYAGVGGSPGWGGFCPWPGGNVPGFQTAMPPIAEAMRSYGRGQRMKVEWISARYEWERLEDEWDALAEQAQDPFSRHAWLTAWWDCFTPPGPMETCIVRDRGG